jgi:hypothetical protein
LQLLETFRIVDTSDLSEIKDALDNILYVPDFRVRNNVIEELILYLQDKFQNPEYKIKVFIGYAESEVCGFVIAQIDPHYTSYSRKCGTFGWLYAKDFDICEELINYCEIFVKRNGIKRIRGCVSFPKNLGGLGIQFMGFEQQMMYSVGYTDPESHIIEYLTRIGYKKDSEYTCVHVIQQSWDKGRMVDKNIRLGFSTLENLPKYADSILELASNSFYKIMPDRSGGNHLFDFFEAYSELPESFYKLKEKVNFENYSTPPEYIEAWESCDLERIQPYVPMAFDRHTGELVGIILCLPDLYEAWRGDPITRVNVDTAMVKKGYYGRGIFSTLNNIGQLTCIMRGLTYFEGTSIWSNNTRAIDTIFPHCKPIRKHIVMQKRL